jgi:N-acetyl-1-D-myo-inositol-2-amino-2-deoxy-alpha-D-glucopyranoside deacetylase
MTQPGGGVLAVFAHPDDEVLCGAGTLALCAARGRPVTLVCATRGELGPIADSSLATRDTLASVRERELRASCAALGVSDLRWLDLPDASVAWTGEERGTLGVLVRLIRTLRPRVLITFGSDGLYGHSDHVAIGELATEARRVAADPSVFAEQLSGACHAFHVPRVFYPVITAQFVVDLLEALAAIGRPAQFWSLRPADFHASISAISASVDVTSVLEPKRAALHSHRTQLDADNALRLLTPELEARFLGVEHFSCADGLPGDPVSG